MPTTSLHTPQTRPTCAARVLAGLIVTLLLASVPGAAWAGEGPAAGAPVTYTVSLPAPQTQMVDISVTFPEVLGTSLDVALPVWRPGKYAIIDAAGTVREVRASYAAAGEEREAPVVKRDKSSWRVSLPPRSAADAPAHRVTVSYRVYANSLADRTRHVDDSHAFLSGSAVFMYAEEFRSRPVRVVVEAPPGWRTATGLEPDAAEPGVFHGASYDVLVDSPLEIGLHDRFTFEVGGIEHEVVSWPVGKLKRDKATMAAEFASITRVQREIFGDLPYSRYVFIFHIAPDARGGTEHLNSFVAQTPPSTFEDNPRAYRGFLKLISHEMFHTWNVKQLRPADLKPYDYRRENYTTLLWVVEGTTSYYDNLCLVRADGADGKPLMKPDDYLKLIGDTISSERARPGLAVQSLADSSYDAWIKFARPTPDSVNSTVSFYSKGAMVSLLLDLEIRKRTDNRVSYDDVLRALYERFPLDGPGYGAGDLLQAIEELTGSAFSAFFEEHVSRPSPLPLERVADVVGLELVFEPAKADDDDDEAEGEQAGERERAYLGLTLSDSGGRTVVAAAYSDGPAYSAGVIPGDEVVAINGRRLRAAELDARLKALAPGDAVRMTMFRRDELREVTVTLAGQRDGKWVLRRLKDATDEQKAAYESWLGRAWPDKK